MCWGGGITVSSGVVRAVVAIDGDLGWRLPLYLQWVWPVPLLIGVYFAPESPWSSVRRGKLDEAIQSIKRLSGENEESNAAMLALIQHTTALERREAAEGSYMDCFRGVNRRRTEIVSRLKVFLLTTELRRVGRSDPVRKRYSRLFGPLPPRCRVLRDQLVQHQHWPFLLLHRRRCHLLVL